MLVLKFYFRFYLALSNMEGIHLDFPRLLSYMPRETLLDYYTIIDRLNNLPQQINQVIELLKAGMEEGIVLHEHSIVSGQYIIPKILCISKMFQRNQNINIKNL